MPFFDWKNQKTMICTWAALGLLSILYYFSLYYTDIYITYDNSLILMDCFLGGKIFDFYEISAQQNAMGIGAVYFIPVYIIFLIWNLPIWFLTRFFGVNIDNMGCLLWSKGLIILFTVGSVWLLYRILQKMGCKEMESAVFLFLSSLFFVCPSLAACQYDIMEVFFMLYGIYLFCQEEKLTWRSLVLFAVAVSVKLLALFPFLLLVLLSEKKVYKVLGYIICAIFPSVVVTLPWYKGYQQVAAPFNRGVTENLFSRVLPGGITDISIFALGFFSICIIAYLSKTHIFQKRFRIFIWLSFAFFLLLFSAVPANPYWIILFLPFIVFLLSDNRQNMRVNLILETVMEGTIILVQGIRFHWVYFSEGAFSYLIFRNPNTKEGITHIGEILTNLGLYSLVPGFYAAFAICGMALLAINNPWKPFSEEIADHEYIRIRQSARYFKVGLVALYIILTYVVAYH